MSRTALLLIDFVNPMDFSGGDRLRYATRAIVPRVLALRERATALDVPVVYVNDNYGEWRSERGRIVDACVERGREARDIVERMKPRRDDYFVVKPHLSGFYATNLPVLLPRLGVDRLVLAGVATDICVLFTAADAHMREYDLWVPGDVVAAETDGGSRWALDIMRDKMQAETRATDVLALDHWVGLNSGRSLDENAERS